MDGEEELPSDKKKGKADLQETLHPLEDVPITLSTENTKFALSDLFLKM
jgi:hypothetical protein